MNQTKIMLAKLTVALLVAMACMGTAVAVAAPELPDGRVYELVSPNTNETAVDFTNSMGLGNDMFQWQVLQGVEPATSGAGVVLRADRTDQGWKVTSRETPPAPRNAYSLAGQFFNRDMSAYYWYAFAPGQEPLGQRARLDVWRRIGDGPAERIPLPQGSILPEDIIGDNVFWGISDDGERVGIVTFAGLVPQDTNGRADLYVLDGTGTASLVSAKADGTPIDSCGAVPYRNKTMASGDLNTVFFTGQGCDGPMHVYARVNLSTTVDVSPSKASAPSPASAPREELGAASDGSQVLFETAEPLLDADTNGHRDIYAYNLRTDQLTWITKGNDAGDDLELQGLVTVDPSLDHIYFVGTGQNAGSGSPGAPNLFVWHDGSIRFVTTLSYDGVQPWQSAPAGGVAQNGNAGVTPDGNRLVFRTSTAIAADDTDSAADLYGYDFATGVLKKLSGGNAEVDVSAPFTSGFPMGPIPILSDDGQYGVFDTPEGIDPRDVNDDRDVYRWRWSDGSSALISGGVERSPFGAFVYHTTLEGISPDGKDVFFQTYARMVPSDTDNKIDYYSARIGGRAEAGPGAGPCEGDACQGDYTAAPAESRASGDRQGAPGNRDTVVRGEVAVSKVSAAALKRASSSGKVAVTVRVNRSGSVTASLVERVGKRSISRGKLARSVSEAGKVTLSVPVSVAGRARLKKSGRLRLTLRVVFSAGLEAQEQSITLRKAAGGKGRS